MKQSSLRNDDLDVTSIMTLPITIKPENMRNLVEHFPQFLTSLRVDEKLLEVSARYQKEGVSGICFLGMGGSSIAGNYVRALLSDVSIIPIFVVRDYTVPAFVTKEWIVIAVSYSGNTEETLSALSMTANIGCRIFTVASGGKMTQSANHPQYLLPEGLQPRSTLPLILSVVLPITETLAGLERTNFLELEKTLLKKAATWNDWHLPPKDVANSLIEKIPLFIGAGHLIPVAYRAKCQINENSKALAFNSEIPESNHNEIESFIEKYGCTIRPIFLRSNYAPSRVKRRLDVTFDLYNEMGLEPLNLEVNGKTKLEEMLLLTHFLDMVSVELAELRNVDPVSVERIKELKHRLRN
ncbi:bifunctional phosphoglucose/phosphomannose isomerase [Candidatus Thorarchaeota archaeon]|nr:MAG: bifunctional phosphoglucose/phosphomannose isomerase [Candidatus Thorarchaeota archaeon]